MNRQQSLLFLLFLPALVISMFWGLDNSTNPSPFLVISISALGIFDLLQKNEPILRNYPIIGRLFFFVDQPPLVNVLGESFKRDVPFKSELRKRIYRVAKGQKNIVSFGTQKDIYSENSEWVAHTIFPKEPSCEEKKIVIGGPDCQIPYSSSHLNISAMGFGPLSKNAILALNSAAKLGGFAQNTGEDGISPYHLSSNGDLIWQLGTRYAGCRSKDGFFDPEAFKEKARIGNVKMIEIKLSQGAKPGLGGLLPGEKVNDEIAEIQGVPVGKDVITLSAHPAFSTPIELMNFIGFLRELSGGKPIGIKLCVGQPRAFLAICKAILKTGILPDYVAVDGAEGGTGAAPQEFCDNVGMPLEEGLVFVHNSLKGISVRDKVTLIASGKIATGFDMFRAMALGTDICYSARGMLFALGCLQAHQCHTNNCPTGIATQKNSLITAIHVPSQAEQVLQYHRHTIHNLLELTGAAGLNSPQEIQPDHLYRRINRSSVHHYGNIYTFLADGVFLTSDDHPYKKDWEMADSNQF